MKQYFIVKPFLQVHTLIEIMLSFCLILAVMEPLLIPELRRDIYKWVD